MLQPYRQKIAHLLQSGPNAFQFTEVDEVSREYSIAESRQFLSKAVRLGRIRHMTKCAQQKLAARKRIRKNSRQTPRQFFSWNHLRFILAARCVMSWLRTGINRHCFVIVDKAMNFEPARLVLKRGLFQLGPRDIPNMGQNLRTQSRIVFEQRIQDHHADRARLSFFNLLDRESIVRCERQLRTRIGSSRSTS